MFEEMDPEQLAVPPAGALEAAIRRGRTIRRQRRTAVISAAAVLSVTLIGGFSILSPPRSNHSLVTPVTHPTVTQTTPPDRSAIPGTWSSEKTPHLDFGILMKVTTAPDGTITLHVDREEFYDGAKAKALNHGQVPLDDYLIKDPDGPRQLTFTLDPRATIRGSSELEPGNAGDGTLRKVTVAEFAAVAKHASGAKVWLRHTGGPDGPVVALTEQFTP